MDDDFGVVKEEIVEEDCPLPCFNGRVVSWLVSAGSSRWQTFSLVSKRTRLWLDRTCHVCDSWYSDYFWEISELQFPDGGSVLSDADTGSQCGQSDALSSLPPGEDLSFRFSLTSFVFTF